MRLNDKGVRFFDQTIEGAYMISNSKYMIEDPKQCISDIKEDVAEMRKIFIDMIEKNTGKDKFNIMLNDQFLTLTISENGDLSIGSYSGVIDFEGFTKNMCPDDVEVIAKELKGWGYEIETNQ